MSESIAFYKDGTGTFNFEKVFLCGIPFVVCALIIYPIVIIFLNSFKIEAWGQPTVFSLSNYITAFRNHDIYRAIVNTLWVSIGTTLLSMVFGCSLAWLITRTNVPCKGLFQVLNTIPLFLSPFVGAIAWMYLAAPRAGFLNKLAMDCFGTEFLNIYGLWGIIWVLGLFFTPIVYLMTAGTLKRMDPSLEEASRGCGSGIIGTTLKITFPLISPALFSAAMLVFVSSAGEFGVPLTLGVPYRVETMVTLIFEYLQRTQPNYNLAAAMGSILLVLTVVLTLISRKLIAGKSYITVTGKGYRPSLINLGRWKYVGFSWNLMFVIVTIFLPIFMLAIISIHSFWLGSINLNKLTLSNYYELIFADNYAMGAFKNSMFLGVAGATLAMCLSTVASYYIYRTRYLGRSTAEYLTNLPIGIPGIVLAMGFLLAFIETPLYGTIWILMVSYIIRFIPYGLRSVSSVLLSLSPELDESSRGHGASWLGTMKNVTLPLLKPGFMAGWLLLFIIFFREFPISMLLWSSGNQVVSVALWQLLEHRTAGLTSAYAILQIIVIFIVLFIAQKLVGTGEIEI